MAVLIARRTRDDVDDCERFDCGARDLAFIVDTDDPESDEAELRAFSDSADGRKAGYVTTDEVSDACDVLELLDAALLELANSDNFDFLLLVGGGG